MNKNYIIGGISLALIAGIVIGYMGGAYQYSAQLDKAKKAFPAVPSMSSVSGTIKSISGNTITLQTPPSANPFEDIPVVREVNVTDKTKIVKSEPIDPKIYQQKMADYNKALQKAAPAGTGSATPVAGNLPALPQPFSETILKVSDLKVGDMITVDAGKDIKAAASFDAVKITLGAGGAVPAGLTPADLNRPTGAVQGTAPIVTTPQVRTDGGVPPQ